MERNLENPGPSWLNSTFVSDNIIQPIYKEPMKIKNLMIKATSEAEGLHFCSDLYQLSVSVEASERNPATKLQLFVKIVPEEEDRKKYVQQVEIFEREIALYNNVVPRMQDILEQFSLRNEYFSPKCFFSSKHTPSDIIVLEDVSVLGFKIGEPKTGLSEKQCLVVLEKIANFHANSVFLHQQNPQIMKPFLHGAFCKKTEKFMKKLFTNIMLWVADEVDAWPNDGKRLSLKIRQLAKDAVEKMGQVTTRKDEELNVLTHGDLWTSNILFKMNGDDVEDVRFVDYQQCHFTSPAVELQYFFHNALLSDVRDGNVENFLKFYYTTFKERLSVFGCENMMVTFNEFMNMYEERAFVGLFITFADVYLTLADSDFNFTYMINHDYVPRKGITSYSELYRNEVLRLVLSFEEKGLM